MGEQGKDAEWTGAERRAAEVRLSEDTVRYLESRITESVAKGMRDAMTEEAAAAFWMAVRSIFKASLLAPTEVAHGLFVACAAGSVRLVSGCGAGGALFAQSDFRNSASGLARGAFGIS